MPAHPPAYGDQPTLPKHEDMIPDPISPYAVSKLTGEHYMRSFTRVYGLETTTLRYFNVFGPHQDPSSQYSGVLAKFSLAMLEGRTPVIYGDGTQSRDFTFIENVVDANLRAISAPAEKVSGRVFNIATEQCITLNDAVKSLRELTSYTGPVEYQAPRAGDIAHSLADISRARAALGYEPKINFHEGLRRTLIWSIRTKAVSRRDFPERCASTAWFAARVKFEDQDSGNITRGSLPVEQLVPPTIDTAFDFSHDSSMRTPSRRAGAKVENSFLVFQGAYVARIPPGCESAHSRSRPRCAGPGAPSSCSRYGRSPDSPRSA